MVNIARAIQRRTLGHIATITGADNIAAHRKYLADHSFAVPKEVLEAAAQVLVYGTGDTPQAIRVLDGSGATVADIAAEPPSQPAPEAGRE